VQLFQDLLSSSVLSKKLKIINSQFYLLFCMGVKLDLSY
jgi:hypothetical protein